MLNYAPKSGMTAVVAIVIVLVSAVLGNVNPKDPVCPGGKVSCSPGQTCCRATGGQFACCPYDNAVCCSDLQSCCPQGYKCDVAARTCNKVETQPGATIPFSVTEPSIAVPPANNSLDASGDASMMVGKKKCPDGQQVCPDSYTCCAQATGGYGCCPLTAGICCEDKVHCCPMGTRCNTHVGSCDS